MATGVYNNIISNAIAEQWSADKETRYTSLLNSVELRRNAHTPTGNMLPSFTYGKLTIVIIKIENNMKK